MDASAFFPLGKTQCTSALANCLDAYRETLEAFLFVIRLAARSDEVRRIAKEALGNSEPDDEPEPTQKHMRRFGKLNSQNLINNSVNSFQRYFAQLVQDCIRKRPETLTSNEQVSVKDIVGLKRMKDVVELLVERRVNKLAYEGIDGIESYLKDRLGLTLFESEEERQSARVMIELRNINVHNGGIVNAIFLDRVGSERSNAFKNGKRHHVEWDEFISYASNMLVVVKRIDLAAAKKFSLKRKQLQIWHPSKDRY